MARWTSILSWSLLSVGLPLVTAQTLDDGMISQMGNNSLFTRWRPTGRIIAPAGWMNDPCGAMYDPKTGLYHIFYQWHPQHINWGNISWGGATSRDLVHWEDLNGWENDKAIALTTGPDGSYDHLGVFSGTAQPVNLKGESDGTLSLFYTSVQHLPTGWAVPYIPGTESQSIATSSDGGKTWSKYEKNPIFSNPPDGWNVTGWRDPFVLPSPELDTLLGQSEPHYYLVLGSGIRENVGPRVPLYSAPATDLTNWKFLGALWEPTANSSFGDVEQTGSYGFNFEVSGFFSLRGKDDSVHYFVQMGTEGGNITTHQNAHWSLWNELDCNVRQNKSLDCTPIAGAAGDWGLLYAMTSFWDSKNNRRIQYGWAPEDIGTAKVANQMGYQGSLGIPRELFVHEVDGVKAWDGQKGASYYTQKGCGAFKARTLGVRPLEDVVCGLRNGITPTKVPDASYTNCARVAGGSNHMEVKATFSNVKGGSVGLTVGISDKNEEYTNIFWDSAKNTINVVRTHSTQLTGFANDTVIGHFTPYTIGNRVEDITMHVFVDGSLVELFVNERFALTTRIYPSRADSTGLAVYVDSSHVDVKNFTVYNGLGKAWPQRPDDSSSPLVWDTAEQTNNYTWWPGN